MELQSRETYTANFLLLRAYTAGAKYFADDAVSELCNKTWRFECGYSDSPYWIAIQLIEAVTPFCSDESRAKLEEAILDYTPSYERTLSGYKERGYACFALLSGIPEELRSERAKARYAELERKFGKTDFAPIGSQVREVVSPIPEAAALKMTDDEWLKAIKRYDSKREYCWDNPTKGGALELARSLQERVQEEPERFARLSLKFPVDTHPFYLEHTLMGLKETNGFTELKLDVCRKAYSESRDEYGRAMTDLWGGVGSMSSNCGASSSAFWWSVPRIFHSNGNANSRKNSTRNFSFSKAATSAINLASTSGWSKSRSSLRSTWPSAAKFCPG